MSYQFDYFQSLEALNTALNENDALLIYFNSSSCNVGEAVAPKIMNLIQEKFSKIKFYFVDRQLNPEIAAAHSVFVEPTVLVFFAGKETVRKSRLFSIDEIEMVIERPYSIIFES